MGFFKDNFFISFNNSFVLYKYLILLSIFFFTTKSFTQVSSYGFNPSLVAYSPLTGSPNVAFASPWDDDVAVPVTLPFTFLFDGNSFTQFYISPNGFITFGTNAPSSINYLPLQDNTVYNSTTSGGVASGLGIDLKSNGLGITYAVEGTSPNRTMVIQWNDAVRKADPGNFNFQIRLNETVNTINFSYGLCVPTGTTNRTVQVGLRGPNNIFAQGNVFNRFKGGSTSAWFGSTVSGFDNTSSVVTVNTSYPDLGLNYRYTPPIPCSVPTAQPTNLLIGTTSISNSTFVGNSFTAASPAPTNYLVLRSTNNVAPTATQFPNRFYAGNVGSVTYSFLVCSNSNLTVFSQSSLVQNTRYYYWVIPYNDLCYGAPFYNFSGIITATAATCINPITANAASSIGSNSFTANWNTTLGANYFIDVATDAAFTTMVPGYNNLSLGTGISSYVVSGLANSTNYYYRIRAVGISCGINSNVINVTTICGSYSIPYMQNFDSFSVGVIPPCYTRINVNADIFQWQTQTLSFSSAPNSLHMSRSSLSVPMDDWFFLPNLNLIGGVSYRLFFRYNSANTSSFFESLRIRLGNSPTIAGMNVTLLDLPSITNSSFQVAIVDFVPVTSGSYNIGFQAYSLADQSSYLVVDDISVTLSPLCFEPSDVNVSSITSNTATVTWNASVPSPANGYQYYLSTSNTPPNSGTAPTGSVGVGVTSANLTGLASSTYYYIFVRGNCSLTDKSVWTLEESFNTECTTPIVTATTNGTRCGIGTTTITATPNPGSIINWYASSSSNSVLATGNNFTTPIINSTTIYYAQAKAFGAIDKVGPTSPTNHGGTLATQNFPASINFYVYSSTNLQSVDIYPMVSGQTGQIVVRNSSNITLATISFTTSVSGGITPQAIPINYNFQSGNYNLYFATLPASGIRINSNASFYPYTGTIADVLSNDYDNTYYLGFYNWKFTTECLSLRMPVTAVITAPPVLTLSSSSSTICEGFSTGTVSVVGSGSYSTLNWTPTTGVTGNFISGFVFNPTITTTYTLNASQSSGSLCGNQITHTVVVNPLPSSIMVVPNAVVVCENTVQSLNGSAGSSGAIPIFTENFNASLSSWTIGNTSFGGDVIASQWTQRPNGFQHIGSTGWDITFHSNDNSQFILANSDAQSAVTGVVTRTTLESPSFNLSGYTTAILNMWQYLRYVTGDISLVEISTDNGITWSTLKTYTSTQGSYSNLTKEATFAYETLDLNPYLGNLNVKVRFNFLSNWGWAWAIDNLSVSGTLASALTWSPITDLYTDAAATIPYTTGVPLSVVYVKPTATRTYTATITGSNSCKRTSTATVTFNAATIAGALSGNQDLCSGISISNIVLSGNNGNVVRWEYADNLAFTINLNSIVNITSTLTPAQMGVFSTIRYFRAVVRNGICSPLNTLPVYVSFPSTTWNGTSWSNGLPTSSMRAIFAGNFSSSGNITACSVVVNSGNVIINTTNTLIVTNEVNVVGGSLVFENNSSLVQINDLAIANSGNITYKRTTTPVKKFDYTYWSSPVFPQTLLAVSPLTAYDKFYNFDQVTNYWVNESPINLMIKGKGYIIRAPNNYNPAIAAVYNANFIGTPNNGVITMPIVVSTGSFNLIGNPYPSALNINAFLSNPLNTSVVDATVYLWTHNTAISVGQYTSNDYAAYNYLGGTGTSNAFNSGINNTIPNGKIASGQAFFIKGFNNNFVTFNNSMRLTSGNDQFFKQSNSNNSDSDEEKHRYWLDIVSPQGAYKQTLIGYAENATLGIDRGYDGTFLNTGNAATIYSLVGSENLTIQGRPLPFDNSDEVHLGYKANLAGDYTINLYSFDGLFQDQDIYLKDNELNTVHNLKLGAYTFTTNSGIFDSRFSIIYQQVMLNINSQFFTENNVVLYKPNKQLIVNSGSTIMKSISVYDIRGRLLLQKDAINASQTALNLDTTNQVVIVKITSTDMQTVTKKYVN